MSVRKIIFSTAKSLTYSDRAERYQQQRHPSDTHHKILDYRVAEILLSTVALAVIALLRHHH
jgi:hypothetical protein